MPIAIGISRIFHSTVPTDCLDERYADAIGSNVEVVKYCGQNSGNVNLYDVRTASGAIIRATEIEIAAFDPGPFVEERPLPSTSLAKLRAMGYVVVMWSPEDIGSADRDILEMVATQRGNEYIVQVAGAEDDANS